MPGTLSGLGRPRHNPADVRSFRKLIEVRQFVTDTEDDLRAAAGRADRAAESCLDL